MKISASERQDRETDRTLSAIKEFTHYIEGMKKDLDRMSKKLHNKETSRSAGFVATGLEEARHYLEIVKKVIEKTQRAIQKSNPKPARETQAPTPSPRIDEEIKSRKLIENWKGTEIWQGECENCHKDTRIASNGGRYLCVDCLKSLKSQTVAEQPEGARGRAKKNLPGLTS